MRATILPDGENLLKIHIKEEEGDAYALIVLREFVRMLDAGARLRLSDSAIHIEQARDGWIELSVDPSIRGPQASGEGRA